MPNACSRTPHGKWATPAWTPPQSSLLRDGSVPVREQALATRLQTRIQDEAAAAMRNAQSLYNRANMEQYMGRANARAQKTAAAGTLLSGFAQGGNALLKW